ncbi:MAG: enoyl-CoA hydratase/isomerase family protein, partial [Flavobacteriales bacterium]
MTQLKGSVSTSIDQGVARISFHHPQSNSLPGELLRELGDAIHAANSNKEVRVMIIMSAGDKAFCAGASFDELSAIESEDEGLKFFSGFAYVINAMRTSSKLIIGRVHARAVGGGVGLACAVDYCFATRNAQLKLSELAVGIGPFVVGPAVQRKAGLAAMSQMAIDATQWHSPDWAHQHGVFQQIFDDITSMDEAINTLANRLAASSPEAMKELKRIFWEGTDHWDSLLPLRAEISGRLVLSDY